MLHLSQSKLGNFPRTTVDLSFSLSAACRSESPISRLPVELLCSIFHKFVEIPSGKQCSDPDAHCVGPQISLASHTDPTLLTQICSYWREVALNLPSLWGTIFIREPKRSQVELTRLWLERAKESSLNLTILQTPVSTEVNMDATWEILSEFVSRSDQWKKIDFQLPSDVIMPLYQMMQGRKCDNLESIDVHATEVIHPGLVMTTRDNTWEIQLEDLWTVFLSSRSLRAVTWRRLPPGGPPSNNIFSQLTSIYVTFNISVDDFFRILSLSHNLQHAQAAISIPSSSSPLSSPSLRLESLRTLRLSTTIVLSDILSKITAPSLTHLNITVDESIASCNSPKPLQDFLQKSGCRLRSFTLADDAFPSDALGAFLDVAELQWLTYLRMEGKLPEKAASRLLAKAENGSYSRIPFLQHIYIGTAWGRLVSSRWHTLPPGQPDDCEKMERFTMCSNRFHSTMDHEFQAIKGDDRAI